MALAINAAYTCRPLPMTHAGLQQNGLPWPAAAARRPPGSSVLSSHHPLPRVCSHMQMHLSCWSRLQRQR